MTEEFEETQIQKTIFETIYSEFDNTTFHYDNKSWRVKKINGSPLSDEDADKLRPVVSRIIESAQQQVVTEVEESLGEPDSFAVEVDELSKALGVEDSKTDRTSIPKQPHINVDQILLIIPEEGAIDIYPRTWFCKNCGYYRLASPSALKTLDCPWCKDKYAVCLNPKCPEKNTIVPKQDTCPTCGSKMGNVKLLQLSILFVCPKCARQEEICPPFVRPDKAPLLFQCETCGGPLRLILKGPMTKWRWECARHPEHQCVRTSSPRVNQFCPQCSTWGKNGEPRSVVSMRLRAASANYLRPRMLSIIRVGATLEINDELLSKAAEWKLSEQGDPDWLEKAEILKRYAIDDLWVIRGVKSYTINYGYTFNSYESDLKLNLYTHVDPRTKRNTFKAYVAIATGKALYIKLNRELVAKTIGIHPFDYEEVASESILKVEKLSSKELKEKGDALISILHAAEHAFLSQSSLTTGLSEDSFAGKILIRDCGILIAERENVGTSGVDYITQRKLLEFMSSAELRVLSCRYDCDTGCVKCLFIRDPLCHPLIPNEGGSRYFIPNSLLSRRSLLKLWAQGGNAYDKSKSQE
jgi:hypothetical protein